MKKERIINYSRRNNKEEGKTGWGLAAKNWMSATPPAQTPAKSPNPAKRDERNGVMQYRS